MTTRMRTENECLALALEMEQKAGRCIAPDLVANYLEMAKTWRHVARQAKWQDAPYYVKLLSG